MKKLVIIAFCSFIIVFAHSQQIRNSYFEIQFNKQTGFFSAVNASFEPLFSGAVTSVITNRKLYTSGSPNYNYKTRLTADNAGNQVLIIEGADKKGELDFSQQITLFNSHPAIGFEVKYKNVSGKEINVRSLEPLRLVMQNNGTLFFDNAEKCLTNGAMYYDAGNIQDLSKQWIRPEPYGETKGGVMSDTLLTANPMTAQSWWNLALFSNSDTEALAAGYLMNANTLGRLQVLKHDSKQLSLVAESVLNPGFVLKPGKEISSDQFVIVTGVNPYEANDRYADLMRETINNPRQSTVNGWCNWFYTLDVFSENEILENAVFAAKHLKPFGLEYIQIDEGYQTTHGDWQGNRLFPHGLKWLCDSIKNLGLKPGIWISPFVISENSDVYKNHPEWLVKDENGQPGRIGPWPSENTGWYREETPKRYCLDITHPEAEKWYTDLVDTIANRWGFEMIKIDFVAWTVFSVHRFSNPGSTPAQVFRHAQEIMRKVAGENCHLLDCGPGHVSGGYINSMRIEYDQNYGFSDNVWTQYFRGSSSSAGAAGKRWFFNNKAWTNDIDHVCIDLLSEHEAQAAATLIGISGGNVMSGDRLMNLDAAKLEILKKIFPSTPENGIPVDLTENDPQTIFTCTIKRNFGTWKVVAFFNPDKEDQVKRSVSLQKFQLDENKTWLAFDFWNQRFAGIITDTLKVTVNPGSTALFSLREKTGFPQIIGTSRHIKQGAVELKAEHYDKDLKTLSVTSVASEGSSHSVFVYLPDGYWWHPRDSKIYEFNQGYTVRQTEHNILRVDIFFENTEKVDWQIGFEQNVSIY